MSDEHVNTIVAELTILDPDLKEHEEDLRVLVFRMQAERPTLLIDETFRNDLRARLLSNHLRAVQSPYQKAERWAFRLAPLGIVALLVLMLTPPSTKTVHETPSSFEEIRDGVETESAPGAESSLMGEYSESSESAPTGGGAGSRTMEMNSVEMGTADDKAIPPNMMKMAAPESPSPLIIPPQKPGERIVVTSITTERPGFIVVRSVRENGIENIFGVSPLLGIGTTTNVPIYLKGALRTSYSYTASFHIDNGDRVFTDGVDMIASDASGNPVITPIEFAF